MAQRRLILCTALTTVFFLFSPPAAAGPSRTAVLADLTVNDTVDGDVVVFAADLMLGENARISGDAIAVGGDVVVADGSRVDRHVMAVFGVVEATEESSIGGRVLSFSSLASLAQGPASGPATARASVAVRLLASGGWLMVTTGLAFLFPVRLRYGAWRLPPLGYKVPALGLLVALTVVASLVAVLGFGPSLGVPLLAGLMIFFFAAKCLGLTVIGCVLGMWLLRRWLHHPLPISLEVFVGMLILLAVRFLPVAGETLWSLLSVMALGASLTVVSAVPSGPTTGSATS